MTRARLSGWIGKRRGESVEMDWFPIETAPKDGTAILLAGGNDGEIEYALEYERHNMTLPCRAWWHVDGWRMGINEAGCADVYYENPTHWAPLPEFLIAEQAEQP